MSNDLDILAERKALGLSQAELARAIGVDQSSVSLWESGKRLPRGPTLLGVLHVLAALKAKRAAESPAQTDGVTA